MLAREDGHAAGSETLTWRQHGDKAQEDSGKWCGDRDNEDERRKGERVHPGHGSSAVDQVKDRIVQCTRARLAGHAVCLATHVSLTRQRGEEQMAADLREGAQRDKRPRRRTQLGRRSEDQCRGTHEDHREEDRGSTSTRYVTGHRECSSQHAQGGSGCGTRHSDSVAPRPWVTGVHT